MDEAEYIKFLQMKRQANTPFMPLINAAQLWMDANNHLQGRLHKQEDPGADNVYKMLDFLYAMFFGAKLTVTAAASVALNPEGINGIYCVLDQDVEFTISGGAEWQRLYLVLKQDGTGDWEASFGSGFGTIANKTAGAGEYSIVSLLYDNENSLWHEMAGGGGGTPGGIPKGEPYPWLFKLVDETDKWTEETGATPTVTIAQMDIDDTVVAFVSLAGSPTVFEVGSGWYGVTVAGTDMDYDTVILLAEATGCKQADQVIKLVEA